eukprot:765744-Hanusia_phi.AAC.1
MRGVTGMAGKRERRGKRGEDRWIEERARRRRGGSEESYDVKNMLFRVRPLKLNIRCSDDLPACNTLIAGTPSQNAARPAGRLSEGRPPPNIVMSAV